MGIAFPPRGMHEAAAGPGKRTTPGRDLAVPWTLVKLFLVFLAVVARPLKLTLESMKRNATRPHFVSPSFENKVF